LAKVLINQTYFKVSVL